MKRSVPRNELMRLSRGLESSRTWGPRIEPRSRRTDKPSGGRLICMRDEPGRIEEIGRSDRRRVERFSSMVRAFRRLFSCGDDDDGDEGFGGCAFAARGCVQVSRVDFYL